MSLLDGLRDTQQLLNGYYRTLKLHRFGVRPDHLIEVADKLHDAREAESDLKVSYARSMKAIRAGRTNAQEVWRLLQDFLDGGSALKKLTAMMAAYTEKLKFVSSVVREGARYVGYGEQSLEDLLHRGSPGSTYVLFFNNEVMKKREPWKANVDLLLDILHDQARRELALMVDCDATEEKLEQARISRFENGANATAKDLLEQRKHLADKSIMRYDEHFLDATITNAPAARRPVKIPCPGPECGPHHLYDWICFKCHVSVEYGHVDRFLYCDCGRTPYDRIRSSARTRSMGQLSKGTRVTSC